LRLRPQSSPIAQKHARMTYEVVLQKFITQKFMLGIAE
jgi:hypothetical protein